MQDSNITKLSSLALEKVNRKDPYSGHAPSDGTLVLGNIVNSDIPSIVNNENYNPLIVPQNYQDNYRIKDATILFNRNINDKDDPTEATQGLQFFYNGIANTIPFGDTYFKLITDPATIKKNQVLVFAADNDGVTLNAATLKAKSFQANDKGFIEHEKRRSALKGNVVKSTVNPSSISDLGYIQFTNDTDTNSEGFIYLDSNPTIVLQHQTAGTGAAAYSNSCVTFTGGGLSASSTSPNAIVEINSQLGGLLPSRLTNTQISALPINSLDKGLILYNSDTNKLSICNGTSFDSVSTTSIFKGTGTLNGVVGVVISAPGIINSSSQVFVTPLVPTSTSNINPATVGSIRININTTTSSFVVYSSVAGDVANFQWTIIN